LKQGTTEKKLLPGEQVTTSPKMEPLLVKEEIAWSRKAEARMALLEQARTQTPPEVQPKLQALPTGKQTFEEAAVRISQGIHGWADGRAWC